MKNINVLKPIILLLLSIVIIFNLITIEQVSSTLIGQKQSKLISNDQNKLGNNNNNDDSIGMNKKNNKTYDDIEKFLTHRSPSKSISLRRFLWGFSFFFLRL